MVRLWALLLACAMSAEAADAKKTPAPTPPPTPAPTPAPTPDPDTSVSPGGAVVQKIKNSKDMGCTDFTKIFLLEYFPPGVAIDSDEMVSECAKKCENYYNAIDPKKACVGFEIRDIPDGVAIKGPKCSLWSGACDMKAITDLKEPVRGQYTLQKKGFRREHIVAACVAAALLLLGAYYLFRPKKAPAGPAKRGIKKPVREDTETEERMAFLPVMPMQMMHAPVQSFAVQQPMMYQQPMSMRAF